MHTYNFNFHREPRKSSLFLCPPVSHILQPTPTLSRFRSLFTQCDHFHLGRLFPLYPHSTSISIVLPLKCFFPPRVMSILAYLFLLCLPLKEEGKVQILSISLMVSYLLFHEYFQFLRLHFYRELPNFFPRRLFLPLHCKSLIFTILSTLST